MFYSNTFFSMLTCFTYIKSNFGNKSKTFFSRVSMSISSIPLWSLQFFNYFYNNKSYNYRLSQIELKLTVTVNFWVDQIPLQASFQ